MKSLRVISFSHFSSLAILVNTSRSPITRNRVSYGRCKTKLVNSLTKTCFDIFLPLPNFSSSSSMVKLSKYETKKAVLYFSRRLPFRSEYVIMF